VLIPHGHFKIGRFEPDVQHLAATIARMGVISFTYDMVGKGESTQVNHNDQNVLTLQLWNSIRVVDFLSSLEGADSSRIAVTGASGGGTQSFLLTAVDSRISVSIPVVMVSSRFYGGCNCESGLPIHMGQNYSTNNAEIAAMAAPRPQLLVSIGHDWTRLTPLREYPYLQKIYALFKKESNIQNIHLPNDYHDYGISKRNAIYPFLAQHLGLNLDSIKNSNGIINETLNIIENSEIMAAFTSEYPRPATALPNHQAIIAQLRLLQEQHSN
jgi:hypothetical protein